MKVCAEPGCAEFTDATRCISHARQRDAARGRRQARGYDTAYDRLRRHWQSRLDAGELVLCWRCDEHGRPHFVDPADWHLGHDNDDRSIIRGPQCPTSNLEDAGRRHPAGDPSPHPSQRTAGEGSEGCAGFRTSDHRVGAPGERPGAHPSGERPRRS